MERAPRKLSEVEGVKARSRHLRGTIAENLAAGTTHFDGADANLLKFHGSYQQYDRDSATARKQAGREKAWQLMVRAKIPGGRLTPAQYLALDALADEYGNGTLRITTRQGIQLHGVLKDDLKATIARINAAMLTTLGACGDVVRNVITTPAPIADAVHRRLEEDARRLSAHFLPRTGAYHEIWLDGEPVEGGEREPLYGNTYLPRKFKIALAAPDDNSVDVLANDLGIIALFDGESLTGYNFAVGGGLGMTHGKADTYPRLATPVAFVPPELLIPAAEAVVALQRDHGNRADRKRARLKYLVDERGLPWVKAELEHRLGRPLEDPRPMPRLRVRDHLGWHEQRDGRWYLGVPVRSGRIVDTDGRRLRTALRRVIGEWALDPVLTPGQDILLSNVAAADRQAIEESLRADGVTLAADMSPFDRWALACPALPTCGLALAEAERIRDGVVARIGRVLARHGLAGERISLRMTGCPNGCARPYTGDIGIVGRMPGHYAVFVGGDFDGTRLSFRLLDRVAEAELDAALEPLIAWYAAERDPGEDFGDFCWRLGRETLLARLAAAGGPAAVAAGA
ncbi:MAG: NADPH-dependent assimilatory sulfite reductase hemoprotein subunit [Rhodospirillaceae bacterium]|nr:NADPH-dependent assimilatory sulfite reductase hemoprotein subunit [Rhodospirillaceae bacterium]